MVPARRLTADEEALLQSLPEHMRSVYNSGLRANDGIAPELSDTYTVY